MSLPEEDGFYWFKGHVYTGLVEMKFIDELGHTLVESVGMDSEDDVWYPDELEGEWWGPLTPPWQREEGDRCENCPHKQNPEEPIATEADAPQSGGETADG